MEENSNKEAIEKENKEQIDNKDIKQKEKEKEHKEETNNNEPKDSEEKGIEISNDVIAVIAGVAASEVEGVTSMAGSFAGGISEVLSGKRNKAKGIKVDKTETTAKIDVNIIVEYGSRIPDVAYEIQKRVKKSVESMTGLTVEEVNVHIQGVDTNFTKSKKKQKVEEQNKLNEEQDNNKNKDKQEADKE